VALGEVTPDDVALEPGAPEGIAVERGPEGVPQQEVVRGGEDREGHVGEAVDQPLDARGDVPGHEAARGRGAAGDPEQVVAFGCCEPQRRREGAEHLPRRMGRPPLLEPHDVVHAHPGEGRELLAAQALRAAPGSGGEADLLGPDALAPRPQHAGELAHPSIMVPCAPGILVPVDPPSSRTWGGRDGGRRMRS